MRNEQKIERIITIGLAVGLVTYFCYQVVYGAKETCPGLMDGRKCVIMDNTPYEYGFYDGRNAGLIAFYQIGDDCDSTIPAHTDQCIKDIPMEVVNNTLGKTTAGMITALQTGGK